MFTAKLNEPRKSIPLLNKRSLQILYLNSMTQQIRHKARNLSLPHLALVLFLATCLCVFIVIIVEVVLEHETHVDEFIFTRLQRFNSPALTRAATLITFFGSDVFLFPAYAILVLFYLFRKNIRLAVIITMTGLVSKLLLNSLKLIFQRTRPEDPLLHGVKGFSFPSGHSFSAFTFFGLLIYIIWRQPRIAKPVKWLLSVFFFLFALCIALTRVYLHLHFASDVMAGFCLSMIWLALTFWLIKILDLTP